jgi:hypothetical protein
MVVFPPRKHDETRFEYSAAEYVNNQGPQPAVDNLVMQIIENRRDYLRRFWWFAYEGTKQ